MDELTIQPNSNAARESLAAQKSIQEARRRTADQAPEKTSSPAEKTSEPSQERPLDQAAVEALTQELNKGFATDTGIRFQVSPESGDLVVQVVDRESDEVIRSIPPERLVEFSKQLGETGKSESGILLDDLA